MGNSDSRRKASTLRQKQIRSKAREFDFGGAPARFVADVMLGRLAKWLRIAGFDVLYSNRYSDEELVTLSGADDRVLLSRDTRLLVRRNVRRFIFLESERIQDQIRQIFRVAGIRELPSLLSRCPACNELLNSVPRENVRDAVPPFVFETQPQFKSCPKCGRIYWAGTHRQAVVRTLRKLLGPPAGD